MEKEPHPILLLDNDRNIIAQYDPTLRGGEEIEGTFLYTMNELDCARVDGRITPAQFKAYSDEVREYRKLYQASKSAYNRIETWIGREFGDLREDSADERVMQEMIDTYENIMSVSAEDLAKVNEMHQLSRAIGALNRQTNTLELIANNLKRAA